ncbi:replication-associated recombination protein A [Candidatus Saccharibacteria bacterium]|nr:replication-associated recombination protein A [Candidatus Saccharibacteria bacterium]
MNNAPLAEKIRPTAIDEIAGQQHLVGKDKIIRRIIESKLPTSLILWGPPGTGKTTLARIIATQTDSEFIELSAVSAVKADVKKVSELAMQNKRLGMQTILFVDEIHRFNKAQQDAFLPLVESGVLVLIGATTENPSFEVINPLLSRSRVLVLEPLTKDDLVQILKRTAKLEGLNGKQLPLKSIKLLAEISAGDARVALNNLELARSLAEGKAITSEIILSAAQKKLPGYDKKGENHYNVISAFIKSLRGSSVEGSLYYLARALQAGEDPKFIARRMVIFASEDIGLSGNGALGLAVATFQAVERIGMPEAQYNLFHCAAALAKSKKSRQVTSLMHEAQSLAQNYPESAVPLHLRNAPTKLMKNLGYADGYKWQADFKPTDGFLPKEITGTKENK